MAPPNFFLTHSVKLMTTTQAHIELVHELLSNTQYGRFGMPFDKIKSAYNRSIKKAGLKGDEAEVQTVNGLLDKKSAAERIEKNKLIPIGTSGVGSAFEQMQQQRRVDKQHRLAKNVEKAHKKAGLKGDEPELEGEKTLLQDKTNELKNEMNAKRLRQDAQERTQQFKKSIHKAYNELKRISNDVMAAYTKMETMKNCEYTQDTELLLNGKHEPLCDNLKIATSIIKEKLEQIKTMTTDIEKMQLAAKLVSPASVTELVSRVESPLFTPTIQPSLP